MPLVQTRGAASAQGFGEFAQATAANYIEDVFSTFLYTGTGATQTITNNIDLSTKGGLVWTKARYLGISHRLVDTARGATYELSSDTTDASSVNSTGLTSFGTTGYTIGSAGGYNNSGGTYVSWTFREQPKFFDVVTYTGNGTNPRNISHNLGSVPGCVIAKRTDAVSPWRVYHRGISPINDNTLALQSTAAASDGGQDLWGNGATVVVPTSTVFTVSNSLNTNGGTYVAYLFAHDAGGFGLTGTDNVISCGSFTTDGSGNATVNLGYEPQFLIHKATTGTESWLMLDTMRGWNMSTADRDLFCNSASAEASGNYGDPTATGFTAAGLSATRTYIYIAIRRGPMKVPTLGTSVYNGIARTGTGAVAQITGVGFPPDLAINADRTRSASANTQVTDRLRGTNVSVFTNRTDGDLTYTNAITAFGSDGETLGTDATQGAVNVSGNTYINWFFRRAPGFFDEVCYTGTGVARDITHNLGAVPELMFVKWRTGAPANWQWGCYDAPSGPTKYMRLNSSDGNATSSVLWNDTAPTASVFTVGTGVNTNENNTTYVAYLFATCAGVSKVGSYTGNGTTQTINCGFGAGGARFVLIKRTDSTGDWYTYDTARGMTVLTDPYLLLNSTAAESATLGSVTTVSTGFALNSTILAAINVNAGSYIFLAIA